MNTIIIIIVWTLGAIVALLGNKKLRDWRDYYNPTSFLITGILLCVLLSWAMVISMIIDGTFGFPKRKRK